MIAFRTPQLFLRPLIPLLVLMVLFCLVAPSNADKNLLDELRDLDIFQLKSALPPSLYSIFTIIFVFYFIRSGISACPLPVVGERCPPSNSLFYFKCCGELNTSCCVRLQVFVWFFALIGQVKENAMISNDQIGSDSGETCPSRVTGQGSKKGFACDEHSFSFP